MHEFTLHTLRRIRSVMFAALNQNPSVFKKRWTEISVTSNTSRPAHGHIQSLFNDMSGVLPRNKEAEAWS